MWVKIDAFKDIFTAIRNEKTLWEKAILVFDRDFLRNEERKNLVKAFQEKMNIRVHIWEAYTFEATILMEKNKFAQLLLLFANVSYQKNISLHDLTRVLNEKTQAVIDEKLENLTIENEKLVPKIADAYNKLLKKLENKNFNKLANNSFILSKSDKFILALDYIREIKDDLTQGKLYSSATKDDVHTVIKNTLHEFDISIDDDISLYFTSLLRLCKQEGIWFKEWDNLYILLDK